MPYPSAKASTSLEWRQDKPAVVFAAGAAAAECGLEKSLASGVALLSCWGLKPILPFTAFLLNLVSCSAIATPAEARSYNSKPWDDPQFFPIAVWLQNPANAGRYKQAGINTYIGLWRGPTEEQLQALKKAGMRVICSQNEVARKHLDNPAILAWMHDDEPDNAQSLGEGKGYGPPVLPEKIIEDYGRMRSVDSTRPVVLNLGQGVAWDDYFGRGTRTRHPEDYPQYIQGCDIVSFDIYPAVHDQKAVAGKLWYVANGVERLLRWGGEKKMVWNCLECTHISNPDRKPTPREVRAEAWMSLIHGSQGLIYFVHQFKPTFREAALLDDPQMLEEVTRLNRQITELAPVLKSSSLENEVKVSSTNAQIPVAVMAKKHSDQLYIFAVAMRSGQNRVSFQLKTPGVSLVEVLGENRTLPVKDGAFDDSFNDWDAHLYRGRAGSQ